MSKKVNKEIIELGNIGVDGGAMMLCDPLTIPR